MWHVDNNTGTPTMPTIAPVAETVPQWFTEGGPGDEPSVPGADTWNIWQAELLNILTAANVVPDKFKLNQIAEAIQLLIGQGIENAGLALEDHTHPISEVEGLQGALDGKSPNGHSHTAAEVGALPATDGAIPEDFWRNIPAAGGSDLLRAGAVIHLGLAQDTKPSLVILCEKYVDTPLPKTGFAGRIYYNRGTVNWSPIFGYVELAVASSYKSNHVKLIHRQNLPAARIVEVTYNGKPHYALATGVTSNLTVIAEGLIFGANDPVLIPDATGYTMVDVLTTEENYHQGNRPTADDVGAISKIPVTVENGVDLDAVTTTGFYVASSYHPNLPPSADGWGLLMVNFIPEVGMQMYTNYKDGKTWMRNYDAGPDEWEPWFQLYTSAHKPTPAEIGAVPYTVLPDNGADLNAIRTSGFYRLQTSHPNLPSGDAAYSQMIVSDGLDTTFQIVISYTTAEMWWRGASDSDGWTAWAKAYSTLNKPTAADGNSDIVASGYGQVGTYAQLCQDGGQPSHNVGSTASGSTLKYSAASSVGSTRPAGTWKIQGQSADGGNEWDRVSVWIRIA